MPDSSNFDIYAVFTPATCEGIVNGWNLVRVTALNDRDAIEKAVEEWFGRALTEGTYLVCRFDQLTAYDIGEKRIPNILAQVGTPADHDA